MADAEIVIIGEDLGDLLGRADQRGGVAVGAGELCDLGPQPLVDARPLFRGCQQPLGAGGGVAVGRLGAPLRYERGDPGSDELFPHLYGPLEADAVERALPLSEGPDGFALPAQAA